MPKIYTKNSTWNDEVLSGAARYDIKENGGAAFKPNMDIALVTGISVAGSPVNATRMNVLENGVDALDTKVADGSDLFTTGGTSTAYTITTTGAAALITGEKFRVKFHATAGATPTLNRDSKGAKSLKYYDQTGTKVACDATTLVANMISDIVYDGTDYVVLDANVVWIKTYLDTLYTAISERVMSGPAGFADNYVITPSVASNNLTLALKGINGSDPSASNPLRFRVGNTVYTLTAATSFTKNAGTNYGGRGSAETAAQDVDWFLYAIGETGGSAGLKFGFSPISHATTMGDMSSTATAQNAIIGNYTNLNSTDSVALIGRFRAQLSAAASYNWSIPTSKVINSSIDKTDLMTYSPALAGFSVNPPNAVYRYQINRNLIRIFSAQGSNGTSNATTFTMTAPFMAVTISNAFWAAAGYGPVDNGALQTATAWAALVSASATINVYKNADGGTTAWTNANGKKVGYFTLEYPLA